MRSGGKFVSKSKAPIPLGLTSCHCLFGLLRSHEIFFSFLGLFFFISSFSFYFIILFLSILPFDGMGLKKKIYLQQFIFIFLVLKK